jgi:hypothetical protein
MISEERYKRLPVWIKRTTDLLRKIRMPGKAVYIVVSLLATIWFLFRVIPKPSRATYPCMQIAAPIMSGFVIWVLAFMGSTLAFRKAKQNWLKARYFAAAFFLLAGIGAAFLLMPQKIVNAKSGTTELKVWYKPNEPVGIAKGIFPGRVMWGHNPLIASWDGKTGFWWEEKYNDQKEVDKLFKETLTGLTGKKNEKQSWDALFRYFNESKKNQARGYQNGEKIAIKINNNNTGGHQNTNEINANPQLILSLLRSLIKEAKVEQQNITVSDPSRFITDNIYDKCHTEFPQVRYVDHIGGDGREKAEFVDDAIAYSADNGKVAKGLAKCMIEANYVINMALLKGHVSQGVTLCAKNYFGCTSIESDWRKNAHSAGFSQDRSGKHTYSVYPDYMGHKDLGGKTMLFLIDGIYSNKFVNQVPAYKWSLAPFNNNWPSSLFASQDGVAIDAVALDFIITEWPDAPDMMYSDYSMTESALADNPPSGTVYDPEKDGTTLKSLGVMEHWNNPIDKKYSRNLNSGNGIELIYKKVN